MGYRLRLFQEGIQKVDQLHFFSAAPSIYDVKTALSGRIGGPGNTLRWYLAAEEENGTSWWCFAVYGAHNLDRTGFVAIRSAFAVFICANWSMLLDDELKCVHLLFGLQHSNLNNLDQDGQ